VSMTGAHARGTPDRAGYDPLACWAAKAQGNYWPPVTPGANPLGWIHPGTQPMSVLAVALPPLGVEGRGEGVDPGE